MTIHIPRETDCVPDAESVVGGVGAGSGLEGGMVLVLMCICLLMLLEHVKFVLQICILRQHKLIPFRSPHGGTEHRVQKFAAPEPRENVVKVHLHSESTIFLQTCAART
jgi:hypothetical protein